MQQTRAAPTAFASSWCSHITPEMSLNNPSTTFTTTIPPPLTKVSQRSASATEVSDHPLESSVDNTPKTSYESRTTVLTSLTLKVSSSTEMSNVSSKTSTVLDLQPTLSSSRVSVVTPRASGSSLVSNPAPKKFVIFPTTSNGTPRVEVSSKSSTVSVSLPTLRAPTPCVYCAIHLFIPPVYLNMIVWASTYKTNLVRLVILQKGVLRIIHISHFNAHSDP